MPQDNLFDPPVDPHELARVTDPVTSHEAAASLKHISITECRRAILVLLRRHRDGLTDEQIAYLYAGPKASPSGLRTRRSELVRAGRVEDSGRKATTKSGRRTIIWVAVD